MILSEKCILEAQDSFIREDEIEQKRWRGLRGTKDSVGEPDRGWKTLGRSGVGRERARLSMATTM